MAIADQIVGNEVVEKVAFTGIHGYNPNGPSNDISEPVIATIKVKLTNTPGFYEVGGLFGMRRVEGWASQMAYHQSYAGVPYLGVEARMADVGLDTPIFSPILNPYLAHYQTGKEAKEKLRVSIRETLNGLLINDDHRWLKEAIALKKWQEENA